MRWHEVARHPPVRRLAELLRRQFNVWSGFIDGGGLAVVAGPDQPVDKPLCAAFAKRQDATGSCARSVTRWLEHLTEAATTHSGDGPQLLSCHAGLNALLVPVVVGGEVIGACYASGFLLSGSPETPEALVQPRAAALNINPLTVRQGCRALPLLNERDLRLLGDLCQALVDEAVAFLGAPPSEAPPSTAPSTALSTGSASALGSAPAVASPPIHMIGDSAPMQQLYALIQKVRRSDATVMITGEPGSGKELVARAIHFGSDRRHEAFVAQNCSAMSDNLLDSELFGHKRGAFTGSVGDKLGLFSVADRGTFFLDEVGDMSPSLQVKLLRVLEEGTFQPVGDTITHKVDVRIIAATHRDLEALIRAGSFRHDLFFRLNVIHLRVPPLRERVEDIPPLVAHFFKSLGAAHGRGHKVVSDVTMRALCAYHWPGNVRELENEVERMVVLSGDDALVPDDLLSPRIFAATTSPPSATTPQSLSASALRDLVRCLPPQMPDAIEQIERLMILQSLQETAWNKTHAAQRLGISRRNLIRKVQDYHLTPQHPDDAPDPSPDDEDH
jgi:DNA-binding NtrC family response regulator